MNEYLTKLKPLLGIAPEDSSKDDRLTFVLETVIQAVKTYCNITSVPAALAPVIIGIAEDYYRDKYASEFPQTALPVQSVKRGDVTTAFGSAKPVVKPGTGAAFVQAYESQLTAFRRLRW